MHITEQLKLGLETAFIDQSINSNLAYKPKFISNNYKNGKKVLSSIEDELKYCDEFIISVAFITESGIAPLLQILLELEEKNIPGKILTTNYLAFSEPKALRKLAKFHNIELRVFDVNQENVGFHTKGYIFKKEEVLKIIIGSSNLTLSALTRNKEWNAELISTEQGELVQDMYSEFQEFWDQSKDLMGWIDTYTSIYEEQKRIARRTKVPTIQQYKLEPNSMQISFIYNLKKIVERGGTRSLLISATGTGKTYASAFALREMNPSKALFLVHREQIAKQAIKSFKNVFGETKTFGLLSGTSKENDADFVFATMQTMSKVEVMESFESDEFPVIVIDEVHRAGAASYQKIMEYFKPDFWLGMTASPDRPDGFDIYDLFDHNIAYEIRLQQALEEDLLCPFHYFGITDLEVNGEVFNDETGLKNFALLISEDRVNYIIEKAEYFGYSGDRVKGLVFCSSKAEARHLSEMFHQRGYNTEYLSGEDSQEKRENAIERLAADSTVDRLDYIFTVDIFNEGVDIPEVNQILMLRPTQSSIVFIQQLGRGLRKCERKEYTIIIDFIGNYMNNFMIPMALSGDRSYNKDTIRRYVMEGSRVIPGSSSIHFDEISKKRIFDSINNTTTTKKLLKEKYFALKHKLGKIPTVLDFNNYGEIDPLIFMSYAKTYDRFVKMVDEDYKVEFTEQEECMLEFVSSFLANGKRPHELLILKNLMLTGRIEKEKLSSQLSFDYKIYNDEGSIDSAINVLEGGFLNSPSDKKRFSNIEFLQKDNVGIYQRVSGFYQMLVHKDFYEEFNNLIELGLLRYDNIYKKHEDDDNLCIYQKYSRKDVCRILNWDRDDSSTMYGYKIKQNTCPIFVTYHKKEDIASSTKYEDHFINNKIFSWMTRSRIKEDSKEAQEIISSQKNGLKIYLFVKKSDGEGTDFYYMGQMKPIAWIQKSIKNDAGADLPIMNFQFELQHTVRDDIYDYITN